jgi:hypothetical protein
MLTFTISLNLHKTMSVTVHNQYPDIELASPVCFCDGKICNEYPVKRMGNSTMMKIDFRFDLAKYESGGILMYNVQRNNTRSDYQYSIDAISAEAVESTSKVMRLLVAWKIDRSWKSRVRIALVEHDNGLVLNEDKLAQLYDEVNDMSSDYNPLGWFVRDNTILMAKYEIEGIGLKVTISKGTKSVHIMKPMWIDLERQVSSLRYNILYANLHY